MNFYKILEESGSYRIVFSFIREKFVRFFYFYFTYIQCKQIKKNAPDKKGNEE